MKKETSNIKASTLGEEVNSVQLQNTWKVLIVDDESDIHKITIYTLEKLSFGGKPLQFLSANSAKEARDVLKDHPDIALIFLDVVMETDDSGLQLVKYIREELYNSSVRIVIRTGQAGLVPEELIIPKYDIDGYLMKLDATRQKLFSTVYTSLRAYRNIVKLETLNNKLEKTIVELEKANAVKNNFLATISHELRTPLNSILGFSNLARVKKENSDSTLIYFINNIKSGADRLNNLMNQLFDFIDVTNGNPEVYAKCFELKQFVDHTCSKLDIDNNNKSITFEINQNFGNETYIISDIQKLSRIITNILENAFKFYENEIKVIFTVEIKDNILVLSISDTGIGMSEEQMKLIFEMFNQNDNSLTRKYGGMGLGLSIVQHYIELLNGSIEVKSKVGEGTNILIKLPVEIGDQQSANDSSTNLPREYKSQKEYKVLMFEDDMINTFVAKMFFEDQGIPFYNAINGEEGIELAREIKPDIILMDIHMPVLNGIEATRQIRKDELLKHIPIVAVSSDAFNDRKKEAIDAGMNSYITKPIDFEDLLGTIAHILNKEKTTILD